MSSTALISVTACYTWLSRHWTHEVHGTAYIGTEVSRNECFNVKLAQQLLVMYLDILDADY